MDTTVPSTASAILASLSATDLENRLREITAEEKAIRTLLRSLRARDRIQPQREAEHKRGQRRDRPHLRDHRRRHFV